jgi:hypothetical protein
MTIPVPLAFKIPDGWQPVEPTSFGLPETTFVAMHPGSANGFTANITLVEQDRTDGATLAQLADESVHKLKSRATDIAIQQRAEVGSPELPGFTQILRLSTASTELVQCQFFMSFADKNNADRRIIVEIALTATPTQLPKVVGDFEKFLTTVRLDQADA